MPDPIAGTPEGGSPAPSPDPSPTPSPDPKPTPTPDPAPGNKGGDEWEKRFKGIQGDLAKERKARQQYEADLKAARAEVESERRRVAALAGVNVASPEEAEAEEIRQRFAKVITPDHLLKMMGLSKEEIDDFKASREDRQRLQAVEKQIWGKHADVMVRSIEKELSSQYGGELSKRQKSTIATSFVVRAQSDPEFLQRYEAGDEDLVKEFAKEWLEDWFEPAKRKITATEVDRFRRVPNGKDRNIVTQGEKKIDVKDDKAVEDLLVAGFRERGGEFGRRNR